jgi:hypothetical protein
MTDPFNPGAPPFARRSLTDRMIGAARLDVPTYEEVEADRTATGQAALVVAIVAVATAIGNVGDGGLGIIGGLLGAFFGWAVWAGITYLIGTKLFGGHADWGELLRTLGFAQAPGVLNVLGIIPLFGGLVKFAVAIWLLVAGVVAIRQALDVSTGKAVLTAVVGWLAILIPMLMLGGLAAIVAGVAR